MIPYEFVIDTPLNDLIFAINHYLSTGEFVGECAVMASNTNPKVFRLILSENVTLPTDREDFAKFFSRANELIAGGLHGELQKVKSQYPFRSWFLSIHEHDIPSWTLALLESPGAAGWGSLKPGIDEKTPGLREKLIAVIGKK